MKKRCAGQRISATIGKTPSGGERTGLLQNGRHKPALKHSSTQELKDSRMVRREIRREIFVSSSASRVLEFLSPRVLAICELCELSTPISLLPQTLLTSRCGGDLPQGFGIAAVTPRRLYPSVGALAPLRKVSSRFQNPAQNISVTRPHIDREPRAQLYQSVP